MKHSDRERHRAHQPVISEIAAAGADDVIVQAGAGAPVRRRRRSRSILLGVFALALAGLWRSGPEAVPLAAQAPEWTIGLTSSGAAPVPALVFGKETGIHFIRIPGRSAPPEEQRRVIARLARGDVYMVSLGSGGLQVSTAAPPGSGVIRMGATGRFVKLYQRPDATGIRTGWW